MDDNIDLQSMTGSVNSRFSTLACQTGCDRGTNLKTEPLYNHEISSLHLWKQRQVFKNPILVQIYESEERGYYYSDRQILDLFLCYARK